MLDKKYKPLEKQEFWKQYWKENKIYDFDRKKLARNMIGVIKSILP